MRVLHLMTSFLACVPEYPLGFFVHRELGTRPQERLILYEFEACLFCRKVREALTMLDLEVEVRPCPKGGERFRPELVERGGKAQFPYLVDPNQGVELYESDDIVEHLYRHYGAGSAPWLLRLGPLSTLRLLLIGVFRPGFGLTHRAASRPEQPLELWSYEISPYCRLVRERLCELELPYELHNIAKRSAGREAFRERTGRMMVPYLVDPNTGTQMHESADILSYLTRTYCSR